MSFPLKALSTLKTRKKMNDIFWSKMSPRLNKIGAKLNFSLKIFLSKNL